MKFRNLILGLSFFISGCGDSPLFNHADPKTEEKASEQAPSSPTKISKEASDKSKELSQLSCDFKIKDSESFDSPLCLSINWLVKPGLKKSDGTKIGKIELKFWNSVTRVFENPKSDIYISLWMPMGMGSDPVKAIPLLDSDGSAKAGVWVADQLDFTMEGEWEISVLLMQNGKETSKVKVDDRNL